MKIPKQPQNKCQLKEVGIYGGRKAFAGGAVTPLSLLELIDFCKDCKLDIARVSVSSVNVEHGQVKVWEYEKPIREHRRNMNEFYKKFDEYKRWAKENPKEAKIQQLETEIQLIREEIRREKNKCEE